ncbi:MAG: SAM-dependent methyltransferase [Elusimicrobiota bacterium]
MAEQIMPGFPDERMFFVHPESPLNALFSVRLGASAVSLLGKDGEEIRFSLVSNRITGSNPVQPLFLLLHERFHLADSHAERRPRNEFERLLMEGWTDYRVWEILATALEEDRSPVLSRMARSMTDQEEPDGARMKQTMKKLFQKYSDYQFSFGVIEKLIARNPEAREALQGQDFDKLYELSQDLRMAADLSHLLKMNSAVGGSALFSAVYQLLFPGLHPSVHRYLLRTLDVLGWFSKSREKLGFTRLLGLAYQRAAERGIALDKNDTLADARDFLAAMRTYISTFQLLARWTKALAAGEPEETVLEKAEETLVDFLFQLLTAGTRPDGAPGPNSLAFLKTGSKLKGALGMAGEMAALLVIGKGFLAGVLAQSIPWVPLAVMAPPLLMLALLAEYAARHTYLELIAPHRGRGQPFKLPEVLGSFKNPAVRNNFIIHFSFFSPYLIAAIAGIPDVLLAVPILAQAAYDIVRVLHIEKINQKILSAPEASPARSGHDSDEPFRIGRILRPGMHIVDFGAGWNPSWAAQMVKEYGIRYTGVEIDPGLVEGANGWIDLNWRDLQDRMKVIHHDARKPLPAGIEKADVVTFNSLRIHKDHLPETSALVQAMWDALKPGGAALIYMENDTFDWAGESQNDGLAVRAMREALSEIFGESNVTAGKTPPQGYHTGLLEAADFAYRNNEKTFFLARKPPDAGPVPSTSAVSPHSSRNPSPASMEAVPGLETDDMRLLLVHGMESDQFRRASVEALKGIADALRKLPLSHRSHIKRIRFARRLPRHAAGVYTSGTLTLSRRLDRFGAYMAVIHETGHLIEERYRAEQGDEALEAFREFGWRRRSYLFSRFVAFGILLAYMAPAIASGAGSLCSAGWLINMAMTVYIFSAVRRWRLTSRFGFASNIFRLLAKERFYSPRKDWPADPFISPAALRTGPSEDFAHTYQNLVMVPERISAVESPALQAKYAWMARELFEKEILPDRGADERTPRFLRTFMVHGRRAARIQSVVGNARLSGAPTGDRERDAREILENLRARGLSIGVKDMVPVARGWVESHVTPGDLSLEEALGNPAAEHEGTDVYFLDSLQAIAVEERGRFLRVLKREGASSVVVTPSLAVKILLGLRGVRVLHRPAVFKPAAPGLYQVNLADMGGRDREILRGAARFFRASVVELVAPPGDELHGRALAAQIITSLLKVMRPAAVDWEGVKEALSAILQAA